jgi:pimeloyl-ACP methyl ester carboxylesterase
MKVKHKERRGGKGVWCYAEVGKRNRERPTIFFVHGFGGDKDTWPNMVKHIDNYHCVIIDLPGHGETTFVDGLDQFGILSYVRAIREFIEVIGLDEQQIFLVG